MAQSKSTADDDRGFIKDPVQKSREAADQEKFLRERRRASSDSPRGGGRRRPTW